MHLFVSNKGLWRLENLLYHEHQIVTICTFWLQQLHNYEFLLFVSLEHLRKTFPENVTSPDLLNEHGCLCLFVCTFFGLHTNLSNKVKRDLIKVANKNILLYKDHSVPPRYRNSWADSPSLSRSLCSLSFLTSSTVTLLLFSGGSLTDKADVSLIIVTKNSASQIYFNENVLLPLPGEPIWYPIHQGFRTQRNLSVSRTSRT